MTRWPALDKTAVAPARKPTQPPEPPGIIPLPPEPEAPALPETAPPLPDIDEPGAVPEEYPDRNDSARWQGRGDR